MSTPFHPGGLATLPPQRQTPMGTYLREWRMAQVPRISQTKLSEMMGWDHSYVSRVENGTRDVGVSQAVVLAEVLDIPEWEVALLICGYDPETVREAIREELRPILRREALLRIMDDSEREVFTMDRKPPFHDLVKQLEKGEIDLDTFVLTADEMGVSRFVVEAVVSREAA